MILSVDINRANTVCAISIMNQNSQRKMNSDTLSSGRPQRREPREIIESSWHPITPRTVLKRWSWGRIHSEASPHMDLRSRLSLDDEPSFHTSKEMMSSRSRTVGGTATYISFLLQRINANRRETRAIIQAPSWGLPWQFRNLTPRISSPRSHPACWAQGPKVWTISKLLTEVQVSFQVLLSPTSCQLMLWNVPRASSRIRSESLRKKRGESGGESSHEQTVRPV